MFLDVIGVTTVVSNIVSNTVTSGDGIKHLSETVPFTPINYTFLRVQIYHTATIVINTANFLCTSCDHEYSLSSLYERLLIL